MHKTIYRTDEIQSAVAGIVRSIVAWADPSDPRPLDVVSVLEGAGPFTRDLLRELERLRPDLPVRVHGVRARATEGRGLLESRQWDRAALEAADLGGGKVLVVDDLVDSGKTLAALRGALVEAGVQEIKTAVLVRKFGEESGPVDFCGFDLKLDRKRMGSQGIKDYWLYGYGMDENGGARELDHIGWVEVR